MLWFRCDEDWIVIWLNLVDGTTLSFRNAFELLFAMKWTVIMVACKCYDLDKFEVFHMLLASATNWNLCATAYACMFWMEKTQFQQNLRLFPLKIEKYFVSLELGWLERELQLDGDIKMVTAQVEYFIRKNALPKIDFSTWCTKEAYWENLSRNSLAAIAYELSKHATTQTCNTHRKHTLLVLIWVSEGIECVHRSWFLLQFLECDAVWKSILDHHFSRDSHRNRQSQANLSSNSQQHEQNTTFWSR